MGGVSSIYGRQDDLNLGFTPHDDPAAVNTNRLRLLDAAKGKNWPLATSRQTHSTIVRSVSSLSQEPEEADALITVTNSLFLGLLTADCVPILLVDTRLRVAGAIHAGWRGTAASIARRAVQAMRDRFASRPQDLLAAIGPAIGSCCYQVGEEVQNAFHQNFSYASSLFQGDRLDLSHANRRQLLDEGLPPAAVTALNLCTACSRTPSGDPLFFSHRAEHGRTGRMMSLIGIAPGASIR